MYCLAHSGEVVQAALAAAYVDPLALIVAIEVLVLYMTGCSPYRRLHLAVVRL